MVQIDHNRWPHQRQMDIFSRKLWPKKFMVISPHVSRTSLKIVSASLSLIAARHNDSFKRLRGHAPFRVICCECDILFSLRTKHLVLWNSEKLPETEGNGAKNRSVMFYESGLRKSKHISNYRQHHHSADLFKKVKRVSNKSAVRGRSFAIELSWDAIFNDFVVTWPM